MNVSAYMRKQQQKSRKNNDRDNERGKPEANEKDE